jgi:hypothetical protein
MTIAQKPSAIGEMALDAKGGKLPFEVSVFFAIFQDCRAKHHWPRKSCGAGQV